MEYVDGRFPETSAVEAMNLSDKKFIAQILREYPANGEDHFSGMGGNNSENYWGIGVAVACAKFGIPLGFEQTEDDLALTANSSAGNYWLNLCGFESRNFPGVREGISAEIESRSGLYTLLHNPAANELFEHVYALHTGTELVDIIQRDPMFAGIRSEQPATLMELADHEGVERMYEEDPEKVLRLYLTRRLPTLKYLRDTIDSTKSFVLEEITDDMDENLKKLIKTINKKRAPHIEFNKAQTEYWQTEYDFTVGLLMEGYRPYDLSEVAPMIEEYVLGLLAFHPELSPSDLRADVPDIRQGLLRHLADIERRDHAEEN